MDELLTTLIRRDVLSHSDAIPAWVIAGVMDRLA